MEISDKWILEYKVEPILDPKYSKKLLITIKNHSPYIKKFKIYTEKIEIKDQFTNLRFRMYFTLISPLIISIEKYKKENVEIKIPRLEYDINDKISIVVENLDKKEIQRIDINLK
ncbi:MAG: hypothetical protein QXV63_00760 [Candidatus Aenigmatarchaeota archaeon]